MGISKKITTDLFWINSFRSDLQLYSEAMSLFCGIVLYHVDDFNEPFSVALQNELVKETLTSLAVCIHKMNPSASRNDVASSIRNVLFDYIDNYDCFEKELLKYIPDIKFEDVICYSVMNANSNYDELDDNETEDHIRQELSRLSLMILKHPYSDHSGS